MKKRNQKISKNKNIKAEFNCSNKILCAKIGIKNPNLICSGDDKNNAYIWKFNE
jgi:hypothetical protein